MGFLALAAKRIWAWFWRPRLPDFIPPPNYRDEFCSVYRHEENQLRERFMRAAGSRCFKAKPVKEEEAMEGEYP